MKSLLFFIALVWIPNVSLGQNEKLEIKIIDSISVSKLELYSRARSFIAYSFKDSKNVIQMDDKEGGKIICKGYMKVISKGTLGITYQNYVDFTLTIDLRNNKYRAVISDLYHSGIGQNREYSGGSIENEKPLCGTIYIPKKDWEKMKDAIENEARYYLERLRKAMFKETKIDDF